MASVWGELKRRNVVKVAVAYAVVAWLIVQIIVSVEAPLNLPDSTDTLVIVFLAIGFVVAIFLAWAYELTPEGVKQTKAVPLSESIARVTGRKLDFAIIGLLVLAVGFMFVENYVLPESSESNVPTGDVLPSSVAVLPFDNLSPNADDAYFAAGLHEEVLNQLAKLRDLSVISRTSVLRYTDSGLSIPEIARDLNVGTVMEGSVRYASDRVRITLQLIDAATDEHLWSETYDREFSDIFAIETDIALNVANALEAEFSGVEQESIERIPTDSLDAYALYLRALSTGKFDVTSEEEIASAIRYVDRATELDPQFALAYSYKALLLTNRGRGRPEVEDWEAVAEEAALIALDIDQNLAWAHAALGGLHHANWQDQEAQQEFEFANELSPNDAHVLAAYAYFKWDTGQFEAALPIALRLQRVDPTGTEYPDYLIGLIQFHAHNYDAAETSFLKHLEFFPTSGNAQMHLARIEVSRGNHVEGSRRLQMAEQLFEGTIYPASWVAMMAEAYALADRPEDSSRLLNELERRSQVAQINNADSAIGALAARNYGEALRWVRAAIDSRELTPGSLQEIKANVYQDPVLEGPEWRDLRARIHPLD
jgi:TolB-like protein/Flp pilus assembly protein TadD